MDEIEHDTSGGDCICGPDVEHIWCYGEVVAEVVIHHSLDGREFLERGEEIPKEAI
jgi:hypothetical protein